MSVRGRVMAGAFAGGWGAGRWVPDALARPAFSLGADVAFRRGGPGVSQLRANLGRVLAATPALAGTDLDGLTHAGLRSYARYWEECFRLPGMGRTRIVRGMNVVDEQRLREAYAAGKGVILALPHAGNWDHAGAWLTATGIPFTTVAERLEPAAVFERFVAFRESLGMEVIPLTGGTGPPFDLLSARLRAGHALCLLADRDLGAGGRRVQFFGEPASMPVGPALLAVRTGAALLPVSLWYDDPSPWNVRIQPHIADPGIGTLTERVTAMTQTMANRFAEGIAAHPADWHMLQPLWSADRSARATGGARA
jgi:lauroyl/myristoyl acyltransferase